MNGVYDLPNSGSLDTLQGDMQKNSATNMALQSANLDAESKKNIYATQVMSAASSTGNQALYDSGKAHLQGLGIDASQWAPDVQSGAQQAYAAKLSQSPFGALLNAASKMDANSIAANTAAGNATPNANSMSMGILHGGMGPSIQDMQNPPQINQTSSAPDPSPKVMTQEATNPPLLPPENPQDPVVQDFQQAQAGQQQKLAQSGQLANNNVQPIDVNGSTPTKFIPPQNDPSRTKAANDANYTQALETWKANPAVIQANEAAKGVGTEIAKQTGAAANSEQMKQKLIQNINGMLAINDQVPDGTMASPESKVWAEKRLGMSSAEPDSTALGQWNQLNDAQILNGLSQLMAQSGVGSSIRSNQTIVKLLAGGQGVPSDMPAASRKALLLNLRTELENSSTASSNVKDTLSGQATQPMEAIPVTAPQKYTQGQILDSPSMGKVVFMGGDPTDKNNYKKVQ